MKYAYFQQDELPTDGGEAKERNGLRMEQARITAWHATFNAFVTGAAAWSLSHTPGDNFDALAWDARVFADKVHGSIL